MVERAWKSHAPAFGTPSEYNTFELAKSQTTLTDERVIEWKGFVFPLSVQSFSLTEDAKVAKYEYALRDGAELERVKSARVFSVSGVFVSQPEKNLVASKFVKTLRELNDNKPGYLRHKDLGDFLCIMKNLKIDEKGDEEFVEAGKRHRTYNFSCEFWEHTPIGALNLSTSERIFPAPLARPSSATYSANAGTGTDTPERATRRKYWKPKNREYIIGTSYQENNYKTAHDLFYALKKEKISIASSTWEDIKDNGKETDLQKEAKTTYETYEKVKTGETVMSSQDTDWASLYNDDGSESQRQRMVRVAILEDTNGGFITHTSQTFYKVQINETALDIAKKFNVSVQELIDANKEYFVRAELRDQVALPTKGGILAQIPFGMDWVKYTEIYGGSTRILANYGVPCGDTCPDGTQNSHKGVDFPPYNGGAVIAPCGGVIDYAGWLDTTEDYGVNGTKFGLGVILKVEVNGKTYKLKFAHMSSLAGGNMASFPYHGTGASAVGAVVQKGQLLGAMGNSGRVGYSCNPTCSFNQYNYSERNANPAAKQLHFEVWGNCSSTNYSPQKNGAYGGNVIEPRTFFNEVAGESVGTASNDTLGVYDSVLLSTMTEGYNWRSLIKLRVDDTILIPNTAEYSTNIQTYQVFA